MTPISRVRRSPRPPSRGAPAPRWAALLAALGLAVAAPPARGAPGAAPAAPAATAPAADPGAAPPPATATVVVKGSDTIGGELGPALARAFEARTPGVTVRWEGLGSATAFPGLLDGSAQLGAASRSVNERELAAARERGIALHEFVLGYDGIAVLVNPANPVRRLTVEQLSDVFTGRIASWRALGGPAVPIEVLSRPAYSGTHAFFEERVLRRGRRDARDRFAPGAVEIEHSEEIVEAVARDPGAIAYVGMGYVRPGVGVVAVSAGPGKPYLTPTVETVRDGSYPIYRPLLLYTRGAPRGAARALLGFVLGPEGRRIVAAHDFTPSDVSLPPTEERAEPAAAAAAPPRASAPVRIRFAVGAADVDRAGREALARVAARARGGAEVRVVGHADAVGVRSANERLARARAEAVAAVLAEFGLPAARIRVEARGADEPVATNETAAGRGANRRVDVELLAPR